MHAHIFDGLERLERLKRLERGGRLGSKGGWGGGEDEGVDRTGGLLDGERMAGVFFAFAVNLGYK